jgi:hypothetical protein
MTDRDPHSYRRPSILKIELHEIAVQRAKAVAAKVVALENPVSNLSPRASEPRKYGKYKTLREWMERWADQKRRTKPEYIATAMDLAGVTWKEAERAYNNVNKRLKFGPGYGPERPEGGK